jgi:hypothetical protein
MSFEAVLQQALLDDAVLENVRRYRAIASLCRQTAAFRPLQKLSLLQQADDWERLAIMELEPHCAPLETAAEDLTADEDLASDEDLTSDEELEPSEPQVDTRWWLPRREGLFAGLQA